MNKIGKSSGRESGFLGFLSGLFTGLLSGRPADKEKKRGLKIIIRELKYRGKYFRYKGNLALPELAEWFHRIYLILGPADMHLERFRRSSILKALFVEAYLPKHARGIINQLSEEVIRKKVDNSPSINSVADELKLNVNQLNKALDTETRKKINSLYTDFIRLETFCSFPFHALLKKFDPQLPEKDFRYIPYFKAIDIRLIKTDLIEFLDVINTFECIGDWERLLKVLKKYRKIDIISTDSWARVLQSCREMINNRNLLLIIKYLEENPAWTPLEENLSYEIVDDFINRIKAETDRLVHDLYEDRRYKAINNLLQKLFGTTSIKRTQYYTEKENIRFNKKLLKGYRHVEPINFLKAFYLDFYKSKIRSMIEFLLIHANWSTKINAQKISDAHAHIVSLSRKLILFDASLADDTSTGAKIKRNLHLPVVNDSAPIALKNAIDRVNTEAKMIISQSNQQLIVLAKNFKKLLNEYQEKQPRLIVNWKTLDELSNFSLNSQLSTIYTQMYNMIQLLTLCMQSTISSEL